MENWRKGDKVAGVIYTLEDLRKWARQGTHLAVLGHPIAHSLSPVMHNAALQHLARNGAPDFASWHYHKFDIPPENLAEALSLFYAKGFRGLNLTLPHKVLALRLVAEVAESGERAGAINALLATPTGWSGQNTDGEGFARSLLEEFSLSLRDSDVVLLGAGGAARAIASTALAADCRSLHIFNRTAERLGNLTELLTSKFPQSFPKIHAVCLYENVSPFAEIPAGAILVNCTSLGLKSGDPSPFPAKFFGKIRAAVDIVYGQTETQFLRDARLAGVPAVNGLPMLCWQGAFALELWTGQRAPVEIMAQALNQHLPQ